MYVDQQYSALAALLVEALHAGGYEYERPELHDLLPYADLPLCERLAARLQADPAARECLTVGGPPAECTKALASYGSLVVLVRAWLEGAL